MSVTENHEQREIRDDQRNGENGYRRLGSFGYQSQRDGDVQDEIFDSNSEGRNPSGEQEAAYFIGTTDFGGMLSQLRKLKEAHLAYVKAHERRLETRLKENREHQAKILSEMDDLEQHIVEVLEKSQSEE